MARRHWTVMIFAEDEGRIHQYRIPRELARIIVGGGLVLLAVLVMLSAGFFIKEGQRLQARHHAEQKKVLTLELDEIRGRMETLRGAMEELSERDEHYRLLAGLEPIHEEVRQVGIGGPGTETLQSSRLWRLNPELGSVAFATAYDLNAMVRRARLLAASWDEASTRLEGEHEKLRTRPSIWPTAGYLSSAFSHARRHPLLHRVRPHEGIDISAPRGAPILATARGRVSFVGRSGDYGLMVELDHGHGLRTRYAHASRTLVRPGQVVERGEKIAEVGATGLAIGTHLHYEVLANGRPVDPLNFILDREVAP